MGLDGEGGNGGFGWGVASWLGPGRHQVEVGVEHMEAIWRIATDGPAQGMEGEMQAAGEAGGMGGWEAAGQMKVH